MKTMRFRITLFTTALFMATFVIQGFGQLTTPRSVSPAAKLTQRIGITDITVNYSRPKVTLRGVDRSGKIWGQQVPYGIHPNPNFPGFGTAKEMPWRAGANENTTIRFTHDVKVGGKDLPAGTYGLHMLIHENGTATVIFSKNHTSWGSFFYDPNEDFLRVDVKTNIVDHTEVLTYSFTDYGANYGVLALSWEKKQIPIRIDLDTHEIILANFRNELRSAPGFGFQGPLTAARYCLTNNVNNEEGLQWAELAITRNKSFPTLSTKAGLLFQSGKRVEGDKILDESLVLATRPQINAVGYRLLGQKRFAKAIEILKLNTISDPSDANAFDSLGDAYAQSGDRANAIINLKKALTLNPAANVKLNSETILKRLGAL